MTKKISLASIALIVGLLGGADVYIKNLCIIMVIDYFTGIIKAGLIEKNLNSEVGFLGLIKKIFILSCICVAHTVESTLGIDYLRSITILFFFSNECLSVIENMSYFIPIPTPLKNILVQAKKDAEETEEIKEDEN